MTFTIEDVIRVQKRVRNIEKKTPVIAITDDYVQVQESGRDFVAPELAWHVRVTIGDRWEWYTEVNGVEFLAVGHGDMPGGRE